jgi:hypothetical protein
MAKGSHAQLHRQRVQVSRVLDNWYSLLTCSGPWAALLMSRHVSARGRYAKAVPYLPTYCGTVGIHSQILGWPLSTAPHRAVPVVYTMLCDECAGGHAARACRPVTLPIPAFCIPDARESSQVVVQMTFLELVLSPDDIVLQQYSFVCDGRTTQNCLRP